MRKLVLEGITVAAIRSFNRIEESLDEPESKPLIAGDRHVLKWNEAVVCYSVQSAALSRNRYLSFQGIGGGTNPEFVLYGDSRVSRIETENLYANGAGDFDGDGIIDDYEMVKDIEDAKSRVNILRKIEGLLYEAIFRFLQKQCIVS